MKFQSLFRGNHNRCFKYPQSSTKCRSLLINGQIKTNSCEIVNHIEKFYENLSSSSPSIHLDVVKSTILDLEARSYWNNDGILDALISYCNGCSLETHEKE